MISLIREREEPYFKNKLAGKTILVVEDQPHLQQITGQFLKALGMQVSLAGTGFEALEKIKKQDYTFILMDLGLPDMKGQAVCEAILRWQKQEDRPLSRIAALSAQLTPTERQACFEAGMQKAYEKPLKREYLEELLEVHQQQLKKFDSEKK